jgi:uncharacterized surface protein with fasciclin (FAS1) repeats
MLKLNSLKGHHQKIRIIEMFGDLFLNMYARIEFRNIKAANGVMHIIDMVLIPPTDTFDKMFMMPTKFSTFTSAMQEVGLSHDVRKEKGITVFAPTNYAWTNLGFDRLLYLFGPHGRHDLKKIVQYHIGTKMTYMHDLVRRGEDEDRDSRRRHDTDRVRRHMRMPTFLKEEELEIEVMEKRHDKFLIVVNKESKVWLSDCPTENGSLQLINEVLIPDSVKFPGEHRGNEGRRDDRRDWDGRRDRDGRRERDGRRDRDGRRREE